MLDLPSRLTRLHTDERGVQNIVGYSLLILIVLGGSSLGLVATAEQLTAGERQTKTTKIETNINLVRGDGIDIVQGAPYRRVNFEGVDGELRFGGTEELEVRASGGDVNITQAATANFTTRLVEYRFDPQQADEAIYRTGFGLRTKQFENSENALVQTQPVMQTGNRRTVLILPQYRRITDASASIGFTQVSQVPITLSRRNAGTVSQLATTDDGSTTVMSGNITVDETPRQNAWVRYFKSSPQFTAKDGPDADTTAEYVEDWDGDGTPEVRAHFESTRLFIRFAQIGVELDARL
ncbi:hypothetical protein RYH80_18685 [Halobaculum sp. MBLA0147]|uniref:DUF7289 family protein n=1 Tax=Halobaculum sp. MBLA0147 TaxID=3079934 RepID=UPI003524F618